MTERNQDKTNKPLINEQANKIDLDNLYRARKTRYQAPGDLKQSLFTEVGQANKDNAPWWHINVNDYTSFAKLGALTACLALIVLVVGVQMIGNQLEFQHQPYANKGNATLVYRSVQIHDINDDEAMPSKQNVFQDPKTLIANSKEQRIIYRREFNQLVAEQNNVLASQQSIAQVLQYDGALQLLTCQKDLLNITEEVVKLIEPNRQKDFFEGQMLTLRFDGKGHIIDMSLSASQTQCYS